MKTSALRVLVTLMLSLPVAANAALVQIEVKSVGIDPSSDPLPTTSVELSFVVDTLSFTSFTYSFSDTYKAFRFEGVQVLSTSLLVDGVDIWTYPDDRTLTFTGQNGPHGPDDCACLLKGAGLYADFASGFGQAFDPLSADPLGIFLLKNYLFMGGVYATGDFGQIGFGGNTTVSLVPAPPAIWLLGTALGFMGAIRRKVTEKRDATPQIDAALEDIR